MGEALSAVAFAVVLLNPVDEGVAVSVGTAEQMHAFSCTNNLGICDKQICDCPPPFVLNQGLPFLRTAGPGPDWGRKSREPHFLTSGWMNDGPML